MKTFNMTELYATVMAEATEGILTQINELMLPRFSGLRCPLGVPESHEDNIDSFLHDFYEDVLPAYTETPHVCNKTQSNYASGQSEETGIIRISEIAPHKTTVSESSLIFHEEVEDLSLKYG